MSSSEHRLPCGERRRKPTPPISPYTFWGRRRISHRPNDYVDRPHRMAWKSAFLLLCLSILDARLSMLLFSTGRIREMNPLLLLGLQMGDFFFLAVKFALTILGIFLLIIHWNFVLGNGQVRVVWLVRTLILAYILVVLYEVALAWLHF